MSRSDLDSAVTNDEKIEDRLGGLVCRRDPYQGTLHGSEWHRQEGADQESNDAR
jgi:hypothetical protein